MEQFSASVVHSKRQLLRANPSQTAVLQEAYARSSTVNTETATELHHKTGLPPKWITQWFARKRSKERKKATTPGRGSLEGTPRSLLTSSSDAGYSPSAAFHVKLEDRDNIMPSTGSSSSVTPFGTTESSQIFSTSGPGPQHILAENQLTSSATIFTRGRKRKQTIANPHKIHVPLKRGRKRNDSSNEPLLLAPIKQEYPEMSGSMDNRERIPAELGVPTHTGTLYADSAVENAVFTDPGAVAESLGHHLSLQGGRTALHRTGFQIAPPKRSFKDPLRSRSNVSLNDPSSAANFSRTMNTFNSADVMIESDSVDRIFVEPTPPTAAPFSLPHLEGIYQRAPIFRTGFQISGPDNFAEATQRGRSGAPASPLASTSEMRISSEPPASEMPFSLQHVSDSAPFPTNDPSGGPYADLYDMRTSQTTMPQLQAWPAPLYTNDEVLQFGLPVGLPTCRIHEVAENIPSIQATHLESSDARLFPTAHTELRPQGMMTTMDACHSLPSFSDGFDHNTYDDVLDPSRAPLKHLVDLLQDFRDEHGDYSRLRCPEGHPDLIRRLANQDLLEQNYFQAAMGHVLLIRLGLRAD